MLAGLWMPLTRTSHDTAAFRPLDCTTACLIYCCITYLCILFVIIAAAAATAGSSGFGFMGAPSPAPSSSFGFLSGSSAPAGVMRAPGPTGLGISFIPAPIQQPRPMGFGSVAVGMQASPCTYCVFDCAVPFCPHPREIIMHTTE